ncbi:ribosomal protein S18-alanine N-acetyltransferase [Metaclostridioides mangenotii]|uniref:ribosomal protein S18-alanine N-acetyltransferase n=1 Tax=Metaclostridioides mangenotii TaxID=1540 RepID=UPI002350ACCB|nr:ribosomal protein S18-alanine N-acetyltransferase [Clostridioides mangenotii]
MKDEIIESKNNDVLILGKMTYEDISGVFEVERACFEDFWSRESFTKEMSNNLAHFIVAKIGNRVVGYIGTWFILDECHINSVAVHNDYRGRKIGDSLMEELISLCKQNNIVAMTLEVRKSNTVAQNLYKKYGFKIAGIRNEYYTNNREDAIIMWNQLEEV